MSSRNFKTLDKPRWLPLLLETLVAAPVSENSLTDLIAELSHVDCSSDQNQRFFAVAAMIAEATQLLVGASSSRNIRIVTSIPGL